MGISTMLSPVRCTSKPSTLPSIISLNSSITSSHPKSQNFLSFRKLSFTGNPVSVKHERYLCMSSSSRSGDHGYQKSSVQGSEAFFRSVLESMQSVYLNRNPTAKTILDIVESADNSHICYDHLAFRTFGVNGYGIDSMASFFLDYGYTAQEELRFPAKKLKALWFSPPQDSFAGSGSGIHWPLPRIFISELLVDQMSPQTQEIIRKYIGTSGNGNKYAAIASCLGISTWEKPLYSEFQQLASESDYAAWTLTNGYALNHVTISTHRLKSHLRNIKNLNQFIEDNNIRLNSEGGVLKVSPDGLLLQSSTIADSIPFQFADGITKSVPCSYIEFAERLVLHQYRNLPDTEVKEFHRRDGFEVGNADKIFESTSKVH